MRKSSVIRPRSRPAAGAAKAADAYHHGDLRQALIDAAFAQVEKEGADSLSLAQLARKLRVSQPAPYKHFADRDALLAAVAARGFREFVNWLQRAAQDGASAARLSRMCHAYVDFGTARAGVYRLMFASPILALRSGDAGLGAVAHESFKLLVDAVGIKEPRRRQLRAVRIWVALHGLVMLTNQGLMNGGEVPISVADLIDAILAD